MSNPIFEAMNANRAPGNMQGLIQQFNEFKRTFCGDPKQKVLEMLQSGQISQAQLNQAQNMANQLGRFFK